MSLPALLSLPSPSALPGPSLLAPRLPLVTWAPPTLGKRRPGGTPPPHSPYLLILSHLGQRGPALTEGCPRGGHLCRGACRGPAASSILPLSISLPFLQFFLSSGPVIQSFPMYVQAAHTFPNILGLETDLVSAPGFKLLLSSHQQHSHQCCLKTASCLSFHPTLSSCLEKPCHTPASAENSTLIFKVHSDVSSSKMLQ